MNITAQKTNLDFTYPLTHRAADLDHVPEALHSRRTSATDLVEEARCCLRIQWWHCGGGSSPCLQACLQAARLLGGNGRGEACGGSSPSAAKPSARAQRTKQLPPRDLARAWSSFSPQWPVVLHLLERRLTHKHAVRDRRVGGHRQ